MSVSLFITLNILYVPICGGIFHAVTPPKNRHKVVHNIKPEVQSGSILQTLCENLIQQEPKISNPLTL